MTLAELTAPFQKRQIIDYAADGKTPRCRWYEMQHITGPLYKGREKMNQYGEAEFDLFLLYKGVEKGLLYARRIRNPERYTLEKMQDSLQQSGYDTLEHLLENMESRIQSDRFVGNAMIEFVRQFDPPRAERYAQHRLAFYARREEEDRQRALAFQAEAEAKRAQREAERKAERAKLHGWADGMSGLRFGQVMAVLNKQIRVNGKVMPKYEFVLWALGNGWMPETAENGKARMEYRLRSGDVYYKVTKTEHDYAVYLVHADAFLKNEKGAAT